MFYKENPSGAVPPPVILAVWAALTYLSQRFLALPFPFPDAVGVVGRGLLIAGVFVCLWAIAAFARHDTVVHHGARARTLITNGPFHFSRNPIYLGMVILAIGVGLVYRSSWALLLVAPLVLALQSLSIVREERYLEQEFGERYARYRQDVRRWI